MKAKHEFTTNEEYQKYLKTYFTAMAMQGWIACQHDGFGGSTEDIVKRSIECADELLKQLES